MKTVAAVLLIGLAVVSALPYDPVVRKLDVELRYQHVQAPDGLYLQDMWGTASDLAQAARFNPDLHNVYHLFTRQNPHASQPLLIGNNGLLGVTNFQPNRRTIVLIHGWRDSVTSDMNRVLIPAFLAAEDVNIIVVDWSIGAGNINYFVAVENTVTSGQGVARFLSWLNSVTGATSQQYHLVGHSLGGHQVGIVGRNLGGQVTYITALDPAGPGWLDNDERFRSTDGAYTEAMHTNAGLLGYLSTLADVDFYPNGGVGMPGCDSSECDHMRCFYYMGESLTGGGFTGNRCASYITAMTGNCALPGSLPMGGLVPKTGQSGVFYLQTNAAPPFSRG